MMELSIQSFGEGSGRWWWEWWEVVEFFEVNADRFASRSMWGLREESKMSPKFWLGIYRNSG